MDERIIIGEVIEETSAGNPIAVLFIDPFARAINYRRIMVIPIIQGSKLEDAEIVMFEACLN